MGSNLLLGLAVALLLFKDFAVAQQISSPQIESRCEPQLTEPSPSTSLDDAKLTTLTRKLRHPDTTSKQAIADILSYLSSQREWSGELKWEQWKDLTHLYNHGRIKHWINAPSLETSEGDRVAWGETRGHLLVITKSGEIYKSYNPARANPTQGFVVDWSDPTLRRLGGEP